MKTLIVGDIQGCHDTLRQLLDAAGFDPGSDELWLAGDLVNRGPQSVETVRYARSLGESCHCVLGNHDLSTLASYHGCASKLTRTAREFQQAPDGAELMEWLRLQPLAHRRDDIVMVHAGVPPQWTIAQLMEAAGELEATLRGPHFRGFFQHMYGNEPARWSSGLTGMDRLRFITNALTRMRYLDSSGAIESHYKLGLAERPEQLQPWFAAPDRAATDTTIVFGHWSTLGQVWWPEHNVWCLDTGAVWGGALTALQVEGRRLFRQPAAAHRRPHSKAG